MMKSYAIIVAGGSGTRMNSAVPKQFLLLKGSPVLFHTLKRFYEYDSSINTILVLPEKHIAYWEKLCKKHKFSLPHQTVAGGKERFFSVRNALERITENAIIAIHDGVRPLVSIETIKTCFITAKKKGNAIPVIPIAESIRQKTKQGNKAVNRNEFCIVQTPQCFRSALLKKAYRQKFSSRFTDDASVVEKCGYKVNLVDGNRENIKITSPADLKIAETLL